jgi:hypothetical protein
MNGFVEIVSCGNKNSLRKLCKKLTVTSEEFTDFIIACEAGLTHLNHTMHFSDTVPAHLEEREADLAVLDAERQVQVSKLGQASLRRLFKAHGERKYNVGHMELGVRSCNEFLPPYPGLNRVLSKAYSRPDP